VNDPNLEQITFQYAIEFLKFGKLADDSTPFSAEGTSEDPWKTEEVYLAQYAAVGALGLLLRSNPDEWWPKVSPVFAEVMVSSRYAAMVKASVMLTYGKLSFYMAKDNPYYTALQELLFTVCTYDNVLISEPACYALVNFALTHDEMYPKVKAIMRQNLGGGLSKADDNALLYHLKSWCKLLAKKYIPVLNLCSTVVFSPSLLTQPITTGPTNHHHQDSNGNNHNQSRPHPHPHTPHNMHPHNSRNALALPPPFPRNISPGRNFGALIPPNLPLRHSPSPVPYPNPYFHPPPALAFSPPYSYPPPYQHLSRPPIRPPHLQHPPNFIR